jgi:hypothetical protein
MYKPQPDIDINSGEQLWPYPLQTWEEIPVSYLIRGRVGPKMFWTRGRKKRKKR